jgi:hypothetical protein
MLRIQITDNVDGTIRWLGGLADIPSGDLEALGHRLLDIIQEDNRKGVLEGFDKDDRAMPPLGYRHGEGDPTEARGRTDDVFGTTAKRFKGPTNYKGKKGQLREAGILDNNNLATWLYQTMVGPRLAPRYESSRVITNLVNLDPDVTTNGVTVQAAWFDVVDEDGKPFLIDHFEGRGQARYDLRGVREWGMNEARQSVEEWARWLVGM